MVVLKLLDMDDFYNTSEVIEIAKGKYKMTESIKEGVKQIKRTWNEKRSNNNRG